MAEIIVKMKDNHIKVKGGEYVQDLIRCKDCKYYEGLAVCELIGDCMGTYGFCGWAESRSGDGANK